MLARFTGSVEPLAPVDVDWLVAWIQAISLFDWPQQSQRELKPAMVTDLNWYDFGTVAAPVIGALLVVFPGCTPSQPMLSVVMPGHNIPPHVDHQPPNWICRVHCPLTTNDQSRFIVGSVHHHMTVGQAYRVNTEAVHSVENDGETPRIHFMFDVRTHA